jgi:hypothetical protein
MKVDGKTGYVITNDHVVAGPGAARMAPRTQVSLVFWSGTKREKTVPAEVLATDPSRDLAVLKVTELPDLAAPLDITTHVELTETMTVWILGFPFGKMLSATRGNPALTIGKGTISSIRNDENDEAKVIQIDGDLNPGNSGGPVVDSAGRLIGISVAKITGTHIGMAIPPSELTRMLNGRIGSVVFRTVKSEAGSVEMEVQANLIDPLNKIKAAGIYYARSDAKMPALKRGSDGLWPQLPGGERLEMQIEGQRAKADFKVAASQGTAFVFQSFYVNGEGKTRYTSPGRFLAGGKFPNDMAMRPDGGEDTDAIKPPKGWYEYRPRGSFFTVWLPEGGRKSDRENTIHIRTSRLKIAQVLVQTNRGMTLLASEIGLPLQLLHGTSSRERMGWVRDALVRELTGAIEEEKEVQVGRLRGTECTVNTGQGPVRFRLFAVGSRIYEARVQGGRGDLAEADANIFLDSFRPAAGAPRDSQPAPPVAGLPEMHRPDILAGSALKEIPGNLYSSIKSAVEKQQLVDADVTGFKLARQQYRDVCPKGGVLIGFDVSLGNFANNKAINALRPIYLTAEGERRGVWIGPQIGKPSTIRAKAGYVVSEIAIKTGVILNGFSLKYAKLDKGHLNLEDTYKSPWLGGDFGGQATIGGQGYFMVGICGQLNDQKIPCSLGYVTVVRGKE